MYILVEKASCENEYWIGDLYCDDGNNHENCHYDGGDCCLNFDLGEYWTTLLSPCSECLCHSADNVATNL